MFYAIMPLKLVSCVTHQLDGTFYSQVLISAVVKNLILLLGWYHDANEQDSTTVMARKLR